MGAESWWSEREERRYERELREDMVTEFQANLRIVEADLAANDTAHARAVAFASKDDRELQSASSDQITAEIGSWANWAGFDPEMGSAQALVESGNIGAISDRKLRLLLSRWAGLLEEKRRFMRCEFHFLALGELPAYRARIDLNTSIMGDYDPGKPVHGADFGEGDWAFLYVPKPWRSFDPDETTRLLDFHSLRLESFRQAGGEFRLIAFDSSASVLSVSRHCTVTESETDDLGGGGWRGQLLDDCDSGDGASGGGIVAVVEGRQYLVGIRNGSHWSEESFPSSGYPRGPPAGAPWNRHTNTNFARGIDADIINKFKKFIKSIVIKEDSI